MIHVGPVWYQHSWGIIPISFVSAAALGVLTTYYGGTYDVLVGLIHLLVVIAFARVFIMPRTSRSMSLPMSWLWLGLLVQLGASACMAYLTSSVMIGDAVLYHRMAVGLASGSIDLGSLRWYGTPMVAILASLWYRLFGVSFLGMFFVSGVVSYLAKCLILRSIGLLTDEPRTRQLTATLILWLPSFSAWNGMLGKEPYISLGIAMTLYGVSLSQRSRVRGGVCSLAGVFVTGVIRPHFAAIELAALVAAGVLERGVRHRKTWVPLLLLLLVLLIGSSDFKTFVGLDEIGLDEIGSRLGMQSASLTKGGGGSATGIGVASGGIRGYLLAVPRSAGAMLLMPYIGQFWDPLHLVVSVETLFMLILILHNARRSLVALVRKRHPFALYCWSFTGLFLLLMSPVLAVNVGLMVRQRTALWLVLICALMSHAINSSEYDSNGRLLADSDYGIPQNSV